MGLIQRVRQIFTKDEDKNIGGRSPTDVKREQFEKDYKKSRAKELLRSAGRAVLEIPETIQTDIAGSQRDMLARDIAGIRKGYGLLKQVASGTKLTDFQKTRLRKQKVEDITKDIRDTTKAGIGALKVGTAVAGAAKKPAILAGQLLVGTGIGTVGRTLRGQDLKSSLTESAIGAAERGTKYASLSGINVLTQPVMNKLAGNFLSGANPVIRQLKSRGAMGALNVGEGLIMDKVSGFETTKESVMIDFTTGATIFAGPSNQPFIDGIADRLVEPLRGVTQDAKIEIKNKISSAVDSGNFEAVERALKEAQLKGMRVNSKVKMSLKKLMMDEKGFARFKALDEKISKLSDNLEKSGRFDEIEKINKEFKTVQEKQQGIMRMNSKIDSEKRAAKEAQRKAINAFRQGDKEAQAKWNNAKDEAIQNAERLEQIKRNSFKQTDSDVGPMELSDEFKSSHNITMSSMKDEPHTSEYINEPGFARAKAQEQLKKYNWWLANFEKEYKRAGMTQDTFVEMAHRELKDIPEEFHPIMIEYKNFMDGMRSTVNRVAPDIDVGYIINYYPHESYGMRPSEEFEMFPGYTFNFGRTEMGHLTQRRTGKMTNYSKNVPAVLKGYIEEAVWAMSGRFANMKPQRMGIMQDTAKITEPKWSGTDWVGKLNQEHAELIPENKTITTLGKAGEELTGGKLETDKSVKGDREWKDFENKEITDAYTLIRNRKDKYIYYMDTLNEFWKEGEIDKAVVTMGKELGLDDDEFGIFARNALRYINQNPPVNFSKWAKSAAGKATYSHPIENFMDVIGKYEIKNLDTKDFINTFFERQVKIAEYKSSALNKLTRLKVMSDLGLKPKTALAQPLELTSLFAFYKPKTIVKGFTNLPGNWKRISDQYLGKFKHEFEIGGETVKKSKKLTTQQYKERLEAELTARGLSGDEVDKKVKALTKDIDKFDKVLKPMEKVFMSMISFGEHLKNVAWASVAEQSAKEQGLKGMEIRPYIKEELYSHAHPADEFSTPEIYKDNDLNKAVGLYTQWSSKVLFETADLIEDKKYTQALGSVVLKAVTTMGLATAFGGSAGWALKNMFDVIQEKGGPMIGLIWDVSEELYNAYEAHKNESWYKQNYHIKQAGEKTGGSFIPGYSQAKKRTYDYLVDRKRGYDETPSGRKRFEVGKGLVSTMLGIAGGTRMTPESKEYWRTKHLNKSEKFLKDIEERGLSNKEVKIVLKAIKEKNPQLHRNILDEMEDRNKNITPKERSIRNIPPKDKQRVNKMGEELNKIDSRKEWAETIERWKDVGIITDKVDKQLKEAIKDGEIKIPEQEEKKEIGINIKAPSMRTARAAEKPVDYEKDTTVYQELPAGPSVYSKEHGGWVRPHMVDFVGDNLEKKRFEQGVKKVFRRQLGVSLRDSTDLDEYYPLMEELPYIYEKAKKFDREGLKELVALQSFFESTAGRAANYNNLFGAMPEGEGGKPARFDNFKDSIDYQFSENVLAGGEEGSSMNILNKKGPITEEEIRELYKSYNPSQKYLETLIKFWKELTGKDKDANN